MPLALPSVEELGPTTLRYGRGMEPTNSSGRPVRHRRAASRPGRSYGNDKDASEAKTSAPKRKAHASTESPSPKRQKSQSPVKVEGFSNMSLDCDGGGGSLSSDLTSVEDKSGDSDSLTSDPEDEDEIASAIAANSVSLETWLNHALPGLGRTAAPLLLDLGITHHAQLSRFRRCAAGHCLIGGQKFRS